MVLLWSWLRDGGKTEDVPGRIGNLVVNLWWRPVKIKPPLQVISIGIHPNLMKTRPATIIKTDPTFNGVMRSFKKTNPRTAPRTTANSRNATM